MMSSHILTISRVLKKAFSAQAAQKAPDARPQASTEPERTGCVREDSGGAENAADGLFQQPVKRLFAICLSLIAGLWISQGLAQEPATSPISITAEHMTVRNLERRVVFEGNVHVQKDDFQMEADQMIVTFAPDDQGVALPGSLSADASQAKRSPPEGRSVSTIDASGHVKIIKGDRRATSETAIYDRAEEKVTLTGNPESWEKDYKVSGTKMTIFLKENRSLVEGSSVLIQP